jgi:hypothetical protein
MFDIDHESTQSFLDSIGDRLLGPGWILVGTLELASAVITATESRYASGFEGFLHHLMDLFIPAVTATIGYFTMRNRREYYRMKLELEQQNERLRLENENFALRIEAAKLGLPDKGGVDV